MATLSISWTVPDNKVNQIKDDFCAYHQRPDTVPDPDNPGQTIPNPESKNAFIKRKVGEFVKDSILAYNANKESETARISSLNTNDAEITLT